MNGWMDEWIDGRASGRMDGWDGMDGWMGGRAGGRTDRDRFHYRNSYDHFVCRRYTELIRPVPEDAISEVSLRAISNKNV